MPGVRALVFYSTTVAIAQVAAVLSCLQHVILWEYKKLYTVTEMILEVSNLVKSPNYSQVESISPWFNLF